MMLQGTMGSETSFGFYVPPPFPPFSAPSPSGINLFDDEDTFRPISDLEAHFTAHFNLEVESTFKNKSKEIYSETFTSADERFNLENSWFFDENKVLMNYHSNISDNTMVNTSQHSEVYSNNNSSKTDEYHNYSNIETKCIYNSCFENSLNISQTNISTVQNSEIYSQNELAYTSSDENDLVIEELSRIEENEECRLSPDILSDDFLSSIIKEQSTLPSIEKAFSKHYHSYSNRDASILQDGQMVYNNLDDNTKVEERPLFIDNLDNYSYPNNILNNITFEKYYQNAETKSMIGTDCSFTDYRYDRKVSVSDSIESDGHIDYLDDVEENTGYPENDYEFVLNLDDLGIHLEDVDDVFDSNKDTISVSKTRRKQLDSEDLSKDMVCYWEACNKVYENQVKLVEHIEKFHVNTYKGEEFSCLWSGCARERRPFNARYKLLIHMRVHSGHKPNSCTHPGCGKSFSRLENLKIHRRSHTGERPYGCGAPHCRKAFSNSSDRAKHQRTHFNARPYACQVKGCSKRYTDPSSLRKHVKNHNPSAISSLKISTKPLPEELPGFDSYDYHANDKRKYHENLGTTSNVSCQSPVKLNTLKSIRNKIQEQKIAAMNSEWNSEKKFSGWSCFEDNQKQGFV